MIVFMAIIKVETVIQLAEKHGFYYKTTGIWHKNESNAEEYEPSFCKFDRSMDLFYI